MTRAAHYSDGTGAMSAGMVPSCPRGWARRIQYGAPSHEFSIAWMRMKGEVNHHKSTSTGESFHG